MTRQEARKVCMICLYQINIYNENHVEYDVKEVIKENSSIENYFVNNVVCGVIKKQNELDALANTYLKDWDIKRLDKTGAAILRMAFYELKYMDTPPVVVINEAVELAKTYNDKELAHMINATLDRYIKE